MPSISRFHYVVVASHGEGTQSVAAGAVSAVTLPDLIAGLRNAGFSEIQVVETNWAAEKDLAAAEIN